MPERLGVESSEQKAGSQTEEVPEELSGIAGVALPRIPGGPDAVSQAEEAALA